MPTRKQNAEPAEPTTGQSYTVSSLHHIKSKDLLAIKLRLLVKITRLQEQVLCGHQPILRRQGGCDRCNPIRLANSNLVGRL
jgi:hypothetical protein